jgi:FkbM family methyltransferase
LRGHCVRCSHPYLQDLPSGHGLVYPTTLDLATGETFDESGADWFSTRLRGMWEQPDAGPVKFDVLGRHLRGQASLLNCLDPVYGHSALKLLNVQRELKGGSNVIALVPESLLQLVPNEVAETWVVREPSHRFSGWLLELEKRLESEVNRLDSCILTPAFPHPHPSTYDLGTLLQHIEQERNGTPSIVLSIRDDRPWGSTAAEQRRFLAIFAARLLAAYPSATVTAVGIGARTTLPDGIRDLRAPTSEPATERRWLAIARGADLVVGVHGSNMLLPSGLAASTIELVPRSRYGNYIQATLFRSSEPVAVLARHRALYGREDLSDIKPDLVADVAISVLTEAPRVDQLMVGSASGVGRADGLTTILASAQPIQPAPPPSRRRRVTMRPVRLVAARAARTGSSLGSKGRSRSPTLPAVLTDSLGNRFELETDEEVQAFRRHRGHFEQAELRQAQELATPGGIVFDVGANIGAFTAALARGVGTNGRVYAFEPGRMARTRLRRTIALNSLSNVVVVDSAVADSPGRAALHSYGAEYGSWATLSPRTIDLGGTTLDARESEDVVTTTLDIYCDSEGVAAVDFLKIDVEGAEQRVLAGSRTVLENVRLRGIMIEVSDNTLSAFGDTAYELMLVLDDYGFDTFVAVEDSLKPFRIAGRFERLANVIALRRA